MSSETLAEKLRESDELLQDGLDQDRVECEVKKERQRQKKRKTCENTSQSFRGSKRKASKPLATLEKDQRCSAAARRGSSAAEPVLEGQTCTTRNGRIFALPARFI